MRVWKIKLITAFELNKTINLSTLVMHINQLWFGEGGKNYRVMYLSSIKPSLFNILFLLCIT